MKIVIIKKKSQLCDVYQHRTVLFPVDRFSCNFVQGRVVKSVKTTDPSITSLQEHKDS